jgi:hypothetical protein
MASAIEHARTIANPAAKGRRFRILDAMILVAATAIGFAASEWLSRETNGYLSFWGFFQGVWGYYSESTAEVGVAQFVYPCSMVAYLMSPIVAMLTLALIPIRLFSPRPRWRRIASQPGMIAACAAGLALVGIGLLISGVALAAGIEDAGRWMLESSFFLPMFLGMAVVTSWMTLLFGRRWRAERSWVDRFGRAIGCYWVVTGLLMICMVAIQECDQPFTLSLPHYTPSADLLDRDADEVPSPSETP